MLASKNLGRPAHVQATIPQGPHALCGIAGDAQVLIVTTVIMMVKHATGHLRPVFTMAVHSRLTVRVLAGPANLTLTGLKELPDLGHQTHGPHQRERADLGI